MRYIDEILALYQGKDPFTRKFILAQILDHPADTFSGQIVEMLRGELKSPDSVVRRQARYALGQYLPHHAAVQYGHAATPEGRRLSAGAAAVLERELSELMSLMLERGSMEERSATSFVLGRLHTPAILDQLVGQVAGVEQVSYQAAFALAEAGEVDGLVRGVTEHGRARPDLFMLLRGLPCPATLACLEAHEEGVDANGRANIAMALAQFGSAEVRPMMERLVRRKEGWVTAYVLQALASTGDPADLPLIKLAFELEPHEFIRVQAVRAAGAIQTDEARAFCMDVLKSSPGRLQSVALEALGTQSNSGELPELARGFLESEFVRTRVQAMLIVAKRDADMVAGLLAKMVLANEPILRLEAAFVTGLVRGPGSQKLLERMAHSDPSAAVRLQAIKSLGRFPPGEAIPALTRFLTYPAAPVVATACRTLASLPPAHVAPALADAIRSVSSPATRAIVLEAAGATARAAFRPPPAQVIEALDQHDPLVRAGALDALKYAGDQIPVERVMPFLVHADPRIRARAALVAWFAGQPEQTGALQALLTSGDEGQVLEAVAALQEIALGTPIIAHRGFTKLAAKLGARVPSSVKAAPPLPVITRPMPVGPRVEHTTLKVQADEIQTSSRDLTDLVAKYDAQAEEYLAGASGTGFVLPMSSRAVPVPTPQEADPPTLPRMAARPRKPKPQPGAQKAAARPTWLIGLVGFGVVMVLLKLAMPARKDTPVVSASASAKGPARTNLKVWLVQGPSTKTAGGGPPNPLAIGSYLSEGDAVEAGASSTVSLRSTAGTSVKLSGGARLKVAQAEPLTLDDPAGEVFLDTKEAEISVKLSIATYRVKTGQTRITSKPDGWTVEQVAGDGTLLSAGGRDVLVVGQSRTVPR